jgi:hypothetical protein
MSFEIKACQVLYYAPHRAIKGRMTGVVRVRVCETFMGVASEFTLDLKCRAEIEAASSGEIRTALLRHAAHQLNRIKDRHAQVEPHPMAVAAE